MIAGDLLVVAGEASGDQHGARMIRELKRLRPGLSAFGLGADQLRAEGVELLADNRAISVVGISEALAILPRAKEIQDLIVTTCEKRRPAAAVLIDFPEFNLRLARKLKWLGIPIVYYISPQVWAWRKGRVRILSELVDRMLVLFAFEAEFYKRHGVPVTHVGHPLVDEMQSLTSVWETSGRSRTSGALRVALLPGSRRSEIRALLPRMLSAIQVMQQDLEIEASVIQAPSVTDEFLAPFLSEHAARGGTAVGVVRADRFPAIADSHLALCASGTATLEVGLLGTPMVVLYRLGGWSYLLAKALVRLPHFSLVNLVLQRGVVPELLQNETAPENVAARALALLRSPESIATMREELSLLRPALGRSGASLRAAQEVAKFLPERPAGRAA
ncbi:MAG: lipid-A-disaccharide synthase [Thermoanaerobaculia bacterium]